MENVDKCKTVSNTIGSLVVVASLYTVGMDSLQMCVEEEISSEYEHTGVNQTFVANSFTNDGLVSPYDVDVHTVKASEIIKTINDSLKLNIDNYFIPNKDLDEKVTLFVTCKKFQDLCEKEEFEQALALQKKMNIVAQDKFGNDSHFGRVAFL